MATSFRDRLPGPWKSTPFISKRKRLLFPGAPDLRRLIVV